MIGFDATPGPKTQGKAERVGNWRRLGHLLAIVFVCAAVMLASAQAKAQSQYVDSGTWLGGSATGRLPPSMNDAKGSWRLWIDGQLRLGDNSSRFSQGLVRPGIGYAWNNAWSVWAGYAYVRTDQPYALIPSNEHRIWEQVSWTGPTGGTELSSRTRLEQRFRSTGGGTGWRLREMGKLIQPLGSKNVWVIAVYDEIFVNLNSTSWANSGADRNRAFAGPGINFSRSVRVELGYLNQYTFNKNGPDRVDHILSINAFWNFSRKESAPEE